jgi:hypothetical protein
MKWVMKLMETIMKILSDCVPDYVNISRLRTLLSCCEQATFQYVYISVKMCR